MGEMWSTPNIFSVAPGSLKNSSGGYFFFCLFVRKRNWLRAVVFCCPLISVGTFQSWIFTIWPPSKLMNLHHPKQCATQGLVLPTSILKPLSRCVSGGWWEGHRFKVPSPCLLLHFLFWFYFLLGYYPWLLSSTIFFLCFILCFWPPMLYHFLSLSLSPLSDWLLSLFYFVMWYFNSLN